MSGPAPDPERPLALFAPGSLLPVQAAIRSGFAAATGAEVVFAPPAYSGVLAARILAGAAADVFVSADPVSMAPLVAAGLLEIDATHLRATPAGRQRLNAVLERLVA